MRTTSVAMLCRSTTSGRWFGTWFGSPSPQSCVAGSARRRCVEEAHGYDGLAVRLISASGSIAERRGRRDIRAAVAGLRYELRQRCQYRLAGILESGRALNT